MTRPTNLALLAGAITVSGNDLVGRGIAMGRTATAQQNRTSTITVADDGYMAFASVPAGYWRVSGMFHFLASVSGAMGLQWKINASQYQSGHLLYSGVVNSIAQARTFVSGNTTVQFTTISTGADDWIEFDAIISTSLTGTVSFQWAQKSSTASALLLQNISWMTIEQVG